VALKAALPGGTGPDVYQGDWPVLAPYAFEEITVPLDDLVDATWGNLRNVLVSAVVDEIEELGQLDGSGHIYAIPCNANISSAFWYNMSIFEELGIAVPKTHDELLRACDTVTEAELIPIAEGADNWRQIDLYVVLSEVAAPGKLEMAQRGEAMLTDDDLVDTFRIYRDMVERGCFGPNFAGSTYGSAQTLWYNGDAAMKSDGMWAWSSGMEGAETYEAAKSWGATVWPDSKVLVHFGHALAITQVSEHKEAAWEFLRWSATGTGAILEAQIPWVPARIGQEVKKANSVFDDNVIKPMLELVNTPELNKYRMIRCAALYDAVAPVMTGVMTNQLTPEEAGLELQDAWDAGCRD
jgi:ABC-type glycerol-3-phosphate transport system substrate-binding protein